MATKHDQLMKELIAGFPGQFVRLAAPRLAERIDLDAVAFEPEEHYPGSPTGRARRADLVSRAYALPERDDIENGEPEQAVLHVEIERQYRAATESTNIGPWARPRWSSITTAWDSRER